MKEGMLQAIGEGVARPRRHREGDPDPCHLHGGDWALQVAGQELRRLPVDRPDEKQPRRLPPRKRRSGRSGEEDEQDGEYLDRGRIFPEAGGDVGQPPLFFEGFSGFVPVSVSISLLPDHHVAEGDQE